MLYVDAATNVPIIGDVVETAGAIGTVAYKYNEQARVTIYVKDVNGVFPKEGSLFLDNGDFVGEYEKKLHNDASDYSSQWGGYWVIDVGLAYNTGPTETSLGDSGKGLIYEDFTPSGQSNENRRYFNILDVDDDSTVNSENTLGSYIRTLSNQGAPGALGITSPILSDLYVVKAPKVLTDATSPGDKINFYIDQLPRWSDNSYIDIIVDGTSIGTFTVSYYDNSEEFCTTGENIDFVYAQLHHPHHSELWVAGNTDYTGQVIEILE